MTRNDWAWWFGINVVACLIAEVTLHDHRGPDAWRAVLLAAWPGFIVSSTISLLAFTVLARVAPAVYHRFDVGMRWLILIPMLVAVAIVGTALAIGLLMLVGYVHGWNGFVATLQDTIKIAIAMTLVFGIYTTITRALRMQLDETARRMATEAQLASLESRVNPHFFFNTLNSIAELTREDAARAERMTTQLASLMRSSLETGSTPLVPLGQEVQSIRDYLEIEHVRFDDRLRYDIRIANEAACALVPRLALQTVVENSVKYAVSPRRGGASVSIAARREGKRVRVEVTDDGPGFDVDTIPEGHGLALIRDRLELLYGNDATLSVTSQPGRTTVAIVVPASNVDA